MPQSLAHQLQSPTVPEFDRGRRSTAKAGLHADVVRGEAATFTLGDVIWEVLLKGHPSAKEMAYAMKTDRSLLRRQIVDGTLPLKKLFDAEPAALAAFGEFLVERFGATKKSKKQIAREKLPELLAAFVEAFAEDK